MTDDLSRMKVEIRRTLDGSDTLFVPELHAHYHSTFGAIQESRHIFIEQGFLAVDSTIDPVVVFEMGFGTGLNVLLTDLTAKTLRREVRYTTTELFPLDNQVWQALNYPSCLPETDAAEEFQNIHEVPWEVLSRINDQFFLIKLRADLRTYSPLKGTCDVVYFDAFDPAVQPDLWSEEVFRKMFLLLRPSGILVTYSCKGDVKRAMKAAGFTLEKLSGPPGKREILRGRK